MQVFGVFLYSQMLLVSFLDRETHSKILSLPKIGSHSCQIQQASEATEILRLLTKSELIRPFWPDKTFFDRCTEVKVATSFEKPR